MNITDFLKTFYEENKSENLQWVENTLLIIEDAGSPHGNKIVLGLKSFHISYDWGGKTSMSIDIRDFTELETKEISFWMKSAMSRGNYFFKNTEIGTYGSGFDKIKGTLDKLKIELQEFKTKESEYLESKERKRLNELKVSQTTVLQELDNDGDGIIDVISGNDFNLLLKKHQNTIIEIDRKYIQQFVKISSYLKTKKQNTQLIFDSIKDTENQEVLNEYVGILKNEIHCYNLLLLSSLNMITALIEEDMILFYEIYESFDKLNMFNSNWENEVSNKLTNIGNELNELMYSIETLGGQIINELNHLNYVTEASNKLLSKQLNSIGSQLQLNNFLSVIQTYEVYRLNN